jgi:ribosome biogenesis GTPase
VTSGAAFPVTDVPGVVVEGTGGVWRVHIENAGIVDATLRGRLKLEGTQKLAVGEHVTLTRDERDAAWMIDTIHPRQSRLARRAPGARQTERVVIANVDQVMVVFAFERPEPHPRMIDRFLVIAEANDLAAQIIMNKRDLVTDATAHEFVAPYAAAGYTVHMASVKGHMGIDALHDALSGRVSVFSGPSGVGKSSLLNAMFPGSHLRVGEISASVNKGRHTTVGARLLPLPGGGYVGDTPGLREVGLWGITAAELDHCFPEFRPMLGECRFQDCAHDREPGCAIRDAVEDSAISPARYESYRKLRSELAAEAPVYDKA